MPRLKTMDPCASADGTPRESKTGDDFKALEEHAEPLADNIPFIDNIKIIASPSINSTTKLAW
jgi:hypothetical protein